MNTDPNLLFSPERKQARRFDTPYRSRVMTEQVFTDEDLSEAEQRAARRKFNETLKRFFPEKSRYNVFFGELHGHSCLSDGKPTPDDYFRNIRDNAKLDFAALTDHHHGGIHADGNCAYHQHHQSRRHLHPHADLHLRIGFRHNRHEDFFHGGQLDGADLACLRADEREERHGDDHLRDLQRERLGRDIDRDLHGDHPAVHRDPGELDHHDGDEPVVHDLSGGKQSHSYHRV